MKKRISIALGSALLLLASFSSNAGTECSPTGRETANAIEYSCDDGTSFLLLKETVIVK